MPACQHIQHISYYILPSATNFSIKLQMLERYCLLCVRVWNTYLYADLEPLELLDLSCIFISFHIAQISVITKKTHSTMRHPMVNLKYRSKPPKILQMLFGLKVWALITKSRVCVHSKWAVWWHSQKLYMLYNIQDDISVYQNQNNYTYHHL